MDYTESFCFSLRVRRRIYHNIFLFILCFLSVIMPKHTHWEGAEKDLLKYKQQQRKRGLHAGKGRFSCHKGKQTSKVSLDQRCERSYCQTFKRWKTFDTGENRVSYRQETHKRENKNSTRLKLTILTSLLIFSHNLKMQLPGRQNGMLILTRADVFGDIRVLFTGHTWDCIIGFAHCKEERRVIASGQLDDIGDQCCRT